MSLPLNYVHFFDGSNYGYWKARMRFFLKLIDAWQIVEPGWTSPETTIAYWTMEIIGLLINKASVCEQCATKY
jgi:hypothetical protein